KLFHRLRSGAFGTPLADQQRKATRVYSPSRSALHGSQRMMDNRFGHYYRYNFLDGFMNSPKQVATTRHNKTEYI
ncbi:hypothetical protein, partial [Caedibacter taeniospiralis]|uniref:hypothetical protein n=1 Tax=Caedibacter taeniospiralis TaxID=28907 RepID=UPI0037C17D8F